MAGAPSCIVQIFLQVFEFTTFNPGAHIRRACLVHPAQRVKMTRSCLPVSASTRRRTSTSLLVAANVVACIREAAQR
jgi:hypothetical protein